MPLIVARREQCRCGIWPLRDNYPTCSTHQSSG